MGNTRTTEIESNTERKLLACRNGPLVNRAGCDPALVFSTRAGYAKLATLRFQ